MAVSLSDLVKMLDASSMDPAEMRRATRWSGPRGRRDRYRHRAAPRGSDPEFLDDRTHGEHHESGPDHAGAARSRRTDFPGRSPSERGCPPTGPGQPPEPLVCNGFMMPYEV